MDGGWVGGWVDTYQFDLVRGPFLLPGHFEHHAPGAFPPAEVVEEQVLTLQSLE